LTKEEVFAALLGKRFCRWIGQVILEGLALHLTILSLLTVTAFQFRSGGRRYLSAVLELEELCLLSLVINLGRGRNFCLFCKKHSIRIEDRLEAPGLLALLNVRKAFAHSPFFKGLKLLEQVLLRLRLLIEGPIIVEVAAQTLTLLQVMLEFVESEGIALLVRVAVDLRSRFRKLVQGWLVRWLLYDLVGITEDLLA